MITFWNDSDGLSIKDVYGILFTCLYVGLCVSSFFVKDRDNVMNLLSNLSPIVLTVIGGYAVTEGAKGVVSYFKSPANVAPTVIQNNDSDGSI